MSKLDAFRRALDAHTAECSACQADPQEPCRYRDGAQQRIARAEQEIERSPRA